MNHPRTARSAVRDAGFTLIELMIVVLIIGVLAAVFLPDIINSRLQANITGDAKNLTQQFQWLELAQARNKLGGMPSDGGHKFLLTLWCKNVIDHSVENMDRFFTPGSDDPYPKELRQQLERGEKIWPDLQSTSSRDTHYAARAAEYIRGMKSATEAWAANDNEGDIWTFSDGTVNILWGNGAVRPLTLQQEMDEYGHPGLEQVFKTFGPDSPVPALQKLDK